MCLHTAAELVSEVKDEGGAGCAGSQGIQNALQRFFWFTRSEFGLMRGTKPGEIEGVRERNALVVRRAGPFGGIAGGSAPSDSGWSGWSTSTLRLITTNALLFIVNDFEHLFELVGEFEQWMKDGKLDNVTPGWRDMSEADVKSFLAASHTKKAH